MPKTAPPDLRDKISSAFTRIEDVTYVGLGVLLAVSALVLLFAAAWSLIQGLSSAGPAKELTIDVLDQILLVLMLIEILSTVQVSFREHVLTPEPFLVVGLIAAIRRILVITAEFSSPSEMLEAAFRNAMFELGLLTALIFSLVFSLYFLKKNRPPSVERQ
ncbi:MAG TPA: phosphate-starvation-inducible PsiE family protein [Candidatus Binatia bacterium]|nr:phosphate-starvation-inducible PsiE family protein [Candidatus Binatia bacterium]